MSNLKGVKEITILFWSADYNSSISSFWFTVKLINPLRPRIVTSVQSVGLYVTISLLRGSVSWRDNTARRALIAVFHVRFLVLNYPAYSPSDILALTSSLTMHRQLNWPSVGLSFQPLLVLFVSEPQTLRELLQINISRKAHRKMLAIILSQYYHY